MRILLTGATGFVGSNLLPILLAKGHDVRCLVRPESKRINRIPDAAEVMIGDAVDGAQLATAMRGCDVAYYLIHSMGRSKNYLETDRRCAQNFQRVAEANGLQKIIYVSGLVDEHSSELSDHLASRLEVGKILRSGTTPCIEFRAAMIIGAESLSFQMVKHLCHRLPIMICPRWLSTRTQPLSLRDLLSFLTKSIESETQTSTVYEIGSDDQLTYLEILREYCRQKALMRIMVPVPMLSPKLSSYWLRLVTPETASVGRELIDGLRNENLVRSNEANQAFSVEPISVTQAIAEAIQRDSVPENSSPLQSKLSHRNKAAKA